jgi:hypothetical protein
MACGMAAGVAYTVTAHPFDTVKVAMQSRKNSSSSSGTAPKSAIAVTSEIIKGPRGALGLFRGLTAPLVGYSIEAGVNYAAFNQSRRWLEHNNPFFPPNDDGSDGGDASSSSSKRSVTRHLAECAVSGALGGSLLSLVVAPTDLIKCRVQDGQFARASDAIRDVVVSSFYFRTCIGNLSADVVFCVKLLQRKNGIFGMTRGTAATLTREVPGNALFFTAYEAAQMSFPRWIDPSTGRSVTDGELIGVNGANNQNNQKSWFSSLAAQEALASVVCGGLAGSAFWLAMLPVDLAKTRYQIAHPGDVDDVGVWRLIRREMRGSRGVRGLWVGELFILVLVYG